MPLDPTKAEALVERLLGGASEPDAAAQTGASTHDTRRLAAMLEDLRAASTLTALFEVDRRVIGRIAADTAPAPGLAVSMGQKLRRWIATLVEETGGTPVLSPGFRGADRGRKIVYRSDGGGVELRIATRRPGIGDLVAGQVAVSGIVGSDFAGGRVVWTSTAGERIVAGIDEEGFFHIELGAGSWEVSVLGADREVVIPRIDLDAREQG